MTIELKGKSAVITGASRGVGKAAALELSRQGINLGLIARSEDKLLELKGECEKLGSKVKIFSIDVTDSNLLKSAIEDTAKEFNGLDILVNNVGISGPGSALEADTDVWDKAMDVNTRSLMHATRFAAPLIAKKDRGNIIFICSVAGKMTMKGHGAYCASKHAITGFAGSVYEDLREENIKVTSICPGYIDTDMVAGHDDFLIYENMIQTQDIAEMITFLCKFPNTSCPTEIILRPQKSPYR